MKQNKQIVKDNISYLIFSELYVKFNEPKAQRKAFMILESAIRCFDKKGFYKVTLTSIEKESGFTRQNIRYYFKDIAEIRNLSLKYIRLIGQKFILSSIDVTEAPDQLFKNYLKAHREWSLKFKSHLRVWLNFLSFCARSEKDMQLNLQAVEAGSDRLQEIIALGQRKGCFNLKDSKKMARLIRTLMLGWLVATVTEPEGPNMDELTSSFIEECIGILEKQA